MKAIEVLNHYPKHHYTLSTLLESRLSLQKDHDCLSSGSKDILNWNNFHSWVSGLSQWFANQKLNKASKIVICSSNSDLYVALFFAISDQGHIIVPLNPDLNDDESTYIIQHSEASLVLCDSNSYEKIQRVSNALKKKVHLLNDAFYNLKSNPKLSHLANQNDPCLILYTSGTTGFPKGVLHSQKNAVMAGEAFVERMQLQINERMLCILPLFHINALFYSVMGAFAAGCYLHISEKFSASKFWKQVSQFKISQVNIIAAIGNILSQRDPSEFISEHGLQKIYGAPVSPSIEKTFRERFKVPLVLEGYGMTEIPGAINNQLGGKWKVGSMGVAALHPNHTLKFSELKIIDENENEVPPGETGELVVKTPILMLGYFKDPQQTSASMTQDGFFKTGDLVKKDAEGFYYFVSRQKDIIRVRGENISGAEIDRAVSLHPKVASCAAIGVSSPLGEEDIYLAVVARDNIHLSEEEIFQWCQEKLSPLKYPKYIKIFPELPHTPTARVAKFKVKQLNDLLVNAKTFK